MEFRGCELYFCGEERRKVKFRGCDIHIDLRIGGEERVKLRGCELHFGGESMKFRWCELHSGGEESEVQRVQTSRWRRGQ